MESVDLFLATIGWSLIECQTRVEELFKAGELNYAKQKTKQGIINVQSTDCVSEGTFGEIKSYGQPVKQSKWSTIEGNGQFAMNKSLAFFTDTLPTLNNDLFQRTKEYIANASIRKICQTLKHKRAQFLDDIMTKMKEKHQKEQHAVEKRAKRRDKILKTKELKTMKELDEALKHCKKARQIRRLYCEQFALIKLLIKENKRMETDIKCNIRDSLVMSYKDEKNVRHKKSTDHLYVILKNYLRCKEMNEYNPYDHDRRLCTLRVPFHQGKLRGVQQLVDVCSLCKQVEKIEAKCKNKECRDPDCRDENRYRLCSKCCKQYSKNEATIGSKRKFTEMSEENEPDIQVPAAKKQKLQTEYCLCAQPYDGTMIGCDLCDMGWFHTDCLQKKLGYTASKIMQITKSTNWECPLCENKENATNQN
eukprot:802713_1